MKIRNGFVSNSSSSSFITVYLPEDFNIDTHLEYLLDRYKKGGRFYEYNINQINRCPKSEIDKFLRNKYYRETDEDGEEIDHFNSICTIFSDFTISGNETYEGQGEIVIFNQEEHDRKINRIRTMVAENNTKYKDSAKEREKKRENLRLKHKDIDPYGEEEWEDTDESIRIKKFKDYKKED